LMVVNKSATASAAQVSLANFARGSGPVQGWQLTAANAIVRLADVSMTGATLDVTLPPQSITLYIVPPAGAIGAPTNLRIVP
jgi:hypothetical protein